MDRYDVLVMGGGLAGWRTAEAAVESGESVALVANGAGNFPDIREGTFDCFRTSVA